MLWRFIDMNNMKYLIVRNRNKISVVRIDKDIGTGYILAIRDTRKAALLYAKILRKDLK